MTDKAQGCITISSIAGGKTSNYSPQLGGYRFYQFAYGNTDLLHTVAIAYGNLFIFQRVEIDRDAVGRADFSAYDTFCRCSGIVI